jgi:hypothetical protein
MRPATGSEAVETGFRAAAEGEPPPRRRWRSRARAAPSTPRARASRSTASMSRSSSTAISPAIRRAACRRSRARSCSATARRRAARDHGFDRGHAAPDRRGDRARRALPRPPGFGTILICGCGAQGRRSSRRLREVLPLRRVLRLGPRSGRARGLRRRSARLRARAVRSTDLGAARASDVIVTCTTAREPFLDGGPWCARHLRRRGRRRQPRQERDRAGLMARGAGRRRRARPMRWRWATCATPSPPAR